MIQRFYGLKLFTKTRTSDSIVFTQLYSRRTKEKKTRFRKYDNETNEIGNDVLRRARRTPRTARNDGFSHKLTAVTELAVRRQPRGVRRRMRVRYRFFVSSLTLFGFPFQFTSAVRTSIPL